MKGKVVYELDDPNRPRCREQQTTNDSSHTQKILQQEILIAKLVGHFPHMDNFVTKKNIICTI